MKKHTYISKIITYVLLFTGLLFNLLSCKRGDILENEQHKISLENNLIRIEDRRSDQAFEFKADFKVLYSEEDPSMANRPAGLPELTYNIITWLASAGADRMDEVKRDEAQQGDGFDDRILESKVTDRTANLFESGKSVLLSPVRSEFVDTALVFYYEPQENYSLRAWLILPETGYPKLNYVFIPGEEGYYSIGYAGAPSFDLSETTEIWQPLIWQEKRFPDQSYLTLAYRCPLPTALVTARGHTFGVVADPSEFPFDPLPLAENSRFGVAVRNERGQPQPMMFAPVMGGLGSFMQPGENFNFSMQLFLEPSEMLNAYKTLAREVYHFRDYRSNGPYQLNRTLENIVQYGMSHWSHFVDSLKGCAYSTDVPGAVKNVSSLNPLEMAIITDDKEIFDKRAYPIMEYLLSREKFLFSLDKEQKIQNPSRKLSGPVAPVSELAALYDISQGVSNAFLTLAEKEYHSGRIRNLSVMDPGDTWQNALALYRATKDSSFLNTAMDGAKAYIRSRVETPATDFNDPDAALFFWTGFTPDYIGLFQLYEATGSREFLDAAHQAAMQYTQFVWLSPEIPDKQIVVNKGGEAPLYWYLKNKGHLPMKAAEETVPAWRLSAIGLTPESSGTCQGHRAIFMAHHAPWMYRIGYEAGDQFLMDVARSAIVGRYSNFPGYHINTARTTIYEKPDYPLRPFKELSVNSFHFNHIWPLASVLMDYLVTDVYVKSNGAIDFPSDFIEGYAYLQSKFYGHKQGAVYGEKAWLWMPKKLMELSTTEVNYLTARGENNLFIVLTNQSSETQDFTFGLDKQLTGFHSEHNVRIWENNKDAGEGKLINGRMSMEIPAKGFTVLSIGDMTIKSAFQHVIVENEKITTDGPHFQSLDFGDARAMILDLGQGQKSAYIYLENDDETFSKVILNYSVDGGSSLSLEDAAYPFEFTIPLEKSSQVSFFMEGKKIDGSYSRSGTIELGP